MRVLVEGSGGSAGWPEPGCRCASCLRQAADGSTRKQSTIVVDGRVRIRVAAGREAGLAGIGDASGREAGLAGIGDAAGGRGQAGDAGGYQVSQAGGYQVSQAGGYQVSRIAGGWELTAPDGERLLYPAGPGAVPVPPPDAAPYDVAFLDVLGDPAQLGWLRARGLIATNTITVVAFADHRVPSEGELERRCGFWRVRLVGDGDAVSRDRSAPKGLKGFNGTRRVLVLGGARSGKSERAELRLAGEPDVTYVATAPNSPVSPDDPDWAARVAAHRARRPAWWRTAETTDLAGLLATARGALLIDGIGTWLAAVLDDCGAWAGGGGADGAWAGGGGARDELAARTAELIGAWRQTSAHVVAVSDETGLGVVPATPAGRLFRDELGRLNQALAAESEEAELVVAGRVLPLGTC